MATLTPDDVALAGEYALGLLDPAEQAATTARIATDPDFAAEVEAWRLRLQPMLDGPDAVPPDGLWQRIEGGLPRETGQDTGVALRWWKGASFVSTGIAAALATMLLLQPAPEAPPPAAPMVAALSGDSGTVLTAHYEAETGQLVITPIKLDTGARVPELWVVPEDGEARSLGIMRQNQPTRVAVPAALRPHMHRGVTLAITPEPEGGAPGGKATGPIIASGTIVST
jgi:anti-sigma-K factor RskA